jgi:hypothetical protein
MQRCPVSEMQRMRKGESRAGKETASTPQAGWADPPPAAVLQLQLLLPQPRQALHRRRLPAMVPPLQ